jgi:hypothetical protein
MSKGKWIALSISALTLAYSPAARSDAVDVFSITKLSSEDSSISVSLAAIPAANIDAFSFSGVLHSPGIDSWSFSSPAVPYLFSQSLDGTSVVMPYIAWHEAGNPNLYNLFNIHTDGSQVTSFGIWSDLTAQGLIDHGFGGCRLGGAAAACPILNAGESIDLKITRLGSTFVSAPDLRVSFTDLSDVASAVPEPSTWAMMILGFAGIGFMAYRRRNQFVAA